MNGVRSLFKNSGLIFKFFQFLAAVFLFSTISILISSVFNTNGSNDVNSLKLIQLVQQLGMFVLPPIALAFLWSEKPFRYLMLTTKVNWVHFLLLLVVMIVAIPFINLLTELNRQFTLPESLAELEQWMKATELEAGKLTEKILNVNTINGLLFNILIVAVLPALGEELFFRGTIQKIIGERVHPVIAIWVAAFIFSAIHFQFYGFIPRMLLGAFFGYLLVWSGSLWLPIFAHFLNNFIAVEFYYLKHTGYKLIDLDTIGSGETSWVGIVSGCLTILLIAMLKKKYIIKLFRRDA